MVGEVCLAQRRSFQNFNNAAVAKLTDHSSKEGIVSQSLIVGADARLIGDRELFK